MLNDEKPLVLQNLLMDVSLTRSDGTPAVQDSLANMSTKERGEMHDHVRNQIFLLEGYERRSKAQDGELQKLKAVAVEIRGAEREHLRAMFEGPDGKVDVDRAVASTPFIRVEQAGVGNRNSPDAPISGAVTRDNAKRTIERSFKNNELPDYAAERATALISTGSNQSQDIATRWIMATGSDEYRSAFLKLCRDPQNGNRLWDARELAAFQQVEGLQRAMSLTDVNGGYMVPFHLDPAIILTNAGTVNPLRAISRVVRTASDIWHGITSTGVTAEWLPEASEAADASPTMAQPAIPVHKGSAFVPYSYEVGMDGGPGFLEELGKLLVDAAGRLQNVAYTTGSGSTQPTGVVTALDGTASEVTPTSGETFTSPDVYKVRQALPPRWQAQAQWLASGAVIDSIDQFETGNGAKKFPGVSENPPSLLRRPLWETSEMDNSINPAATADNFVLLYGDFSQFVIVDRIGTTIELIPNLVGANRRPTGQRGAFMWFRTGSDVTTENAFRVLNVATTA